MATDEDDVLDGELLRTVVRAAPLAALHVVQEEERLVQLVRWPSGR